MNLEQGNKAWHDLRRNKIGASDCPVILGIDPWKTPYGLYQEKFGIVTMKETSAMKRGKELEPFAREEFEKATGIRVKPDVFLHPDHSWMMASLDGISEDGKEAVEIKCPGEDSLTYKLAVEGKVPDHYNAQLQHQMAVLGLQNIFYFVFDGSTGIVLEIKRQPEYINMLIQREKEFWDKLQNFEPPELVNKDYIERNGLEWQREVIAYREAEEEEKRAVSRKEVARKRLIEMAEEQSCRGHGLTLTKYVRRGTIDYNSIPELNGKDLEPYRKQASETWRITIK